MNTCGRLRARIKAKDEAEFRRWEKLAEKLRKRQRESTPRDDRLSLRCPDDNRS